MLSLPERFPRNTILKYLSPGTEDIVKTVNAGTPKTISYNSAIKQIRKKNARGDLMLYGTERVFDNA